MKIRIAKQKQLDLVFFLDIRPLIKRLQDRNSLNSIFFYSNQFISEDPDLLTPHTALKCKFSKKDLSGSINHNNKNKQNIKQCILWFLIFD